jgi:hypothetical protein
VAVSHRTVHACWGVLVGKVGVLICTDCSMGSDSVAVSHLHACWGCLDLMEKNCVGCLMAHLAVTVWQVLVGRFGAVGLRRLLVRQ